MNKAFMVVLTAVIALIPAIASASVPPVSVPEPATGILQLAAGVGAAAFKLKRLR